MHGLPAYDGNNTIDWGQTSADYSTYRPGPPQSFYDRLKSMGVGLSGQAVLDLGTGTGVLARRFALQGAKVAGIDMSAEQIAAASQLSIEQSLDIDFVVGQVESLPWPDSSFDVATANQCWLYFDANKVVDELRRVLKPGGWLVTSHFSWLPRLDELARQSEALVLEFNPNWSAADWSGEVPNCPAWADGIFRVRDMFIYDEPIEFSREGWRGRMRACRGVGASMSPERVAEFDAAHDKLLKETAPETFNVLHRIDAHIFQITNE